MSVISLCSCFSSKWKSWFLQHKVPILFTLVWAIDGPVSMDVEEGTSGMSADVGLEVVLVSVSNKRWEQRLYLSKNIKGGKEKYRQKEDKTLIFTQNISFSDANLTILPHLYIYNLVFSSSWFSFYVGLELPLVSNLSLTALTKKVPYIYDPSRQFK